VPSAVVFPSVVIPTGQLSATFPLMTNPVVDDIPVTVSATATAGQTDTKSVQLTLRRLPRPSSFTLRLPPTTGFSLSGTLTMDRHAPLEPLGAQWVISGTSDAPSLVVLTGLTQPSMPPSNIRIDFGVKIQTSSGPAVVTRHVPVPTDTIEYRVLTAAEAVPQTVTLRFKYSTPVDPGPGELVRTIRLQPYFHTLSHTVSGTTGTVTLNNAAPFGGAVVTITTPNGAGRVTGFPKTVTIPQGQLSATYTITLESGATLSGVTFVATYAGNVSSVTVP
jgi:hypothetical protein